MALQCIDCKWLARDMIELKRHRVQSHAKYYCVVCDQDNFGYVAFSGYTGLREHLRKAHRIAVYTEEERIGSLVHQDMSVGREIMHRPVHQGQRQSNPRQINVGQTSRRLNPMSKQSVIGEIQSVPRMVSSGAVVYRPRNKYVRNHNLRGNRSNMRFEQPNVGSGYLLVRQGESGHVSDYALGGAVVEQPSNPMNYQPLLEAGDMQPEYDEMMSDRDQSGGTLSTTMMEMVTRGVEQGLQKGMQEIYKLIQQTGGNRGVSREDVKVDEQPAVQRMEFDVRGAATSGVSVLGQMPRPIFGRAKSVLMTSDQMAQDAVKTAVENPFRKVTADEAIPSHLYPVVVVKTQGDLSSDEMAGKSLTQYIDHVASNVELNADREDVLLNSDESEGMVVDEGDEPAILDESVNANDPLVDPLGDVEAKGISALAKLDTVQMRDRLRASRATSQDRDPRLRSGKTVVPPSQIVEVLVSDDESPIKQGLVAKQVREATGAVSKPGPSARKK